jgi:heme/copper-type cytochrome/quinol oxidase subunit 2
VLKRSLLTLLALLPVILWIAMSYLPPAANPLPDLSAWLPATTPVLAWLAAAGLALFLLIQVVVTRASARMFRSEHALARNEVNGEFAMRRSAEVFWTVLPLLMIAGLAVLSAPTWRSILGR